MIEQDAAEIPPDVAEAIALALEVAAERRRARAAAMTDEPHPFDCGDEACVACEDELWRIIQADERREDGDDLAS